MAIRLHITKPGGDSKFDNVVRLRSDTISLGRRPENAVVLDDGERQISGEHARIEFRDGSYRLVDLGSRNGTFVDERRLDPAQPVLLRNGTIIQIGMLEMKVSLDEPGSDLSRTIVQKNPKHSAAVLGERLASIYSANLGADKETRAAAMRQEIDGALRDSDLDEARAVLSIVRENHRHDGVGDEAAIDTLGQQEQLFRSGYQAIQGLSQHLLRHAEFQSAEDVGRFVRLVQQTLDGMLGWVSTALQGRAEFKEQFGAEVTQIFFHKEHNPLKGGGDSETIAQFLLDWSSRRSLGEIRSHWEQALRDLSMHQFSLLRAVQETLRKVFEKLDPEELERQAEDKAGQGSWMQKIVGGENPWEIYKGAFAQMRDEQSRFFDGVISPAMKKGYIDGHQEYLDKLGDSTVAPEQTDRE